MKSITFKIPISDGSVREISGYLTATPGLVVHHPPVKTCFHEGDCWTVSSVRSGECFPFCWQSPEAALAFAEHAKWYGTWHITGEQLRRRMALPFVRESMTRRAFSLDGARMWGPTRPIGRLDNGAVA
jgi:hypothetical protein